MPFRTPLLDVYAYVWEGKLHFMYELNPGRVIYGSMRGCEGFLCAHLG